MNLEIDVCGRAKREKDWPINISISSNINCTDLAFSYPGWKTGVKMNIQFGHVLVRDIYGDRFFLKLREINLYPFLKIKRKY